MNTQAFDPAFPVQDYSGCQYPGLTLRDYFAAKAMQGMIASGESASEEKQAGWAYRYADAMLKARGMPLPEPPEVKP